MTINNLNKNIKEKNISVTELICQFIDKIEKAEDKYNSYITVTKDHALLEAKKKDKQLSQMTDDEIKKLSPLFGIPYSAKDLYLTKGIRTTSASKILDNYIPVYNSISVDRIESCGAILVGKNNCDPFGFGSSTENSDYGVSSNAYNHKMVAGGSSGGGAASVALGTSVFSLGTDTGGSVRQPASFNNVVGIKPTYGLVPRYGVMAFASSLDTMGHFTKTVSDNACVLNITAGYDKHDATSSPRKHRDFASEIGKDIKGLKIGINPKTIEGQLDPMVKEATLDAIRVFEKLGAEIIDIDLKMTDYASAVYYILATSEASSNLARYDGMRFGHSDRSEGDLWDIYNNSRSEGFNDEIKRRIILGTYALSSGYYDEYYKKALKMRTLVIEDYNEAFKRVDTILSPVFPDLPFEIGQYKDDPIKIWLADALTVTVNVFGGPSLAIPAGFKNDLPVGIQLIGPNFSENKLYQIGYAFEQETKYFEINPAT